MHLLKYTFSIFIGGYTWHSLPAVGCVLLYYLAGDISALLRYHELPPDKLADLDIAEVHLNCALGLPGSETLDVSRCLARIDEMAMAVDDATTSLWYKFEAHPYEYHGAHQYFRMMVLATVLQRNFGVAYNVEWFEKPPDCTDCRYLFLHGILEGIGGTCVSLPILYTAVGRRLGYPLKIVRTVSHMFCRWEDENSEMRFNIEATAKGLVCHSDEHYKNWPIPMTRQHLEGTYYLRSHTATEELAGFYSTRAECLFDNLRFGEAMAFMKYARDLYPSEPNYEGFHLITCVAFRINEGITRYDGQHCMAFEHDGQQRPMEPWEVWALKRYVSERARVDEILRNETSSTDTALMSFEIYT